MPKIAVIAKLKAKDGQRDALVDALGGLVDGTAQEEGTELYVLNVDAADPNAVWFFEVYKDQDAMTAHNTSDTMKTVGPKLVEFLDGGPELHFLTPRAAKGVDVA